METHYEKWFSPSLGRDMELKVYGRGGKPVLYIPCQDGRFFDFENFRMTDAWAPFIDSGQTTVFSVDTMDLETFSAKNGDPYWRIRRHEAWITYISNEVVPYIRSFCRGYGWQTDPGIMAFGCSLGATHAANLYFRFPHLFDEVLALSGVYDIAYGFDGYMDDLVYLNAPVLYLSNMPADHPYFELYRRNRAVICVGQGPWEMPDDTRTLHRVLVEKGIPAWVDYWGYDTAHDWPWWYKQVSYFVPELLKQNI
ncbi:MAG: esterase family protein [Oscillospiraceae bacterium]|nr:esterase family protein [Oscillospiraceae bacterium]